MNALRPSEPSSSQRTPSPASHLDSESVFDEETATPERYLRSHRAPSIWQRARTEVRHLRHMNRQELDQHVQGVLRRYPWQSVAVAFALGTGVGLTLFRR